MIGDRRRDRIKRFIVVFKIPLTLTIIALASLSMHFMDSLPTLPDGSVPFLISVVILSLPSYMFAIFFLNWIDPDNPGVRVLEADAGSDEKGTPHVVPREIWDAKTVNGPKPYKLDDGAYLVREFDWKEDVGQLEVTGVWAANASAVELWRSKKRIDDMHDWYRVELQKAAASLARIDRMGIEMFDGSVNALSRAEMEGAVPDADLISDPIDSAKEDVADHEDPPAMEEALNDVAEDVQEAAEHAEETMPDQSEVQADA
jgi:hypothetical protein